MTSALLEAKMHWNVSFYAALWGDIVVFEMVTAYLKGDAAKQRFDSPRLWYIYVDLGFYSAISNTALS